MMWGVSWVIELHIRRLRPSCQNAHLGGGQAGHQRCEQGPGLMQDLLLGKERVKQHSWSVGGGAQGQFGVPRRVREGRETEIMIHRTRLTAPARARRLPLARAGVPRRCLDLPMP